MTTGDTSDMASRIRAVLPASWFPDVLPNGSSATPVLDAVLQGLGASWSWLYSLVAYVKLQSRIATATSVFLDMASADYFGTSLRRRVNEGDLAFRARIFGELLAPKATRGAIVAVLRRLTGNTASIIEPWNIGDVGAIQVNFAFDVAGRFGATDMPYQFFVSIARPLGSGVANVNGFNGSIGGFDHGAIEMISMDMIAGTVTDGDIYAAVDRTRPAGSVAWVAISTATS